MTVNVPPSQDHHALAAAVNARMAADSRIVNAKAAALRLAGAGGMVALTGAGVFAALLGWSFVKDEKPSADRLADAMVRALDRTTLKAAGEFRLADDQKVRLDHATVALDPAAMVKLDPAAKVQVEGAGGQPRPTAEQLKQDAKPVSGAKPVTNYTVFKSVPFGQGSVVTGWSFTSSEQTAPSGQYCYYVQGMGGDETNAQVKVDVALNGAMLPNLKPRGFDPREAAASCTWFDGRATRGT